MKRKLLPLLLAVASAISVSGQINIGSNGSDGAFAPTTNTVIDMSDHPNGVYQYATVNIPTNVTVSFIPNANNSPVIWLVQSNAVINGSVNVSGQSATSTSAGAGGPGGYAGGACGLSGHGPGAGRYYVFTCSSGYGYQGGSPAGYGTPGWVGNCGAPQGGTYGNSSLIPLLGGSGGGGGPSDHCISCATCPGRVAAHSGGGGGAILIACSDQIKLNGSIVGHGGNGVGTGLSGNSAWAGGCGSGGGIRLVASSIWGSGFIAASGGAGYCSASGGAGRVRFDTYLNNFSGRVDIGYSQGAQFMVFPTNGVGSQLTIASVGGVTISPSPSGVLTTPDVVLSAQQVNPIPVVVQCNQIPLNTAIIVTVTPADAPAVSGTNYNSSGTVASSTATVLVNMPRGGGIINATAATGN